MKDLIVFSHMMKTAGTSLAKNFIEYYGRKVLQVKGGSRFKVEEKGTYLEFLDRNYDLNSLKNDLNKKRDAKFIFGHHLRPFIDFDIKNYNLRWFTFLRDPNKRYISHYFHSFYFMSNQFSENRYKTMKTNSIVEWEKIDLCSNYQCKFISGEPNSQKAIDILENKFEWIGITEEYEEGVASLKNYFDIAEMHIKNEFTNPSLANKKEKENIFKNYGSFIREMNEEDQILYNYVKKNVWPKFKNIKIDNNIKIKSNKMMKNYNFLSFHIDMALNFSDTKITKKNLMRFIERWYK